jgi:two-component system, OmpR family, sensor histidine kinase SenX3
MSWVALALAFATFFLGVQLGRRRGFEGQRAEVRKEVSAIVPDIDVSPAGFLTTTPGLQQVLDVLPVGIIVVDVAGVEVTRNKMAEEITGLRHLDLLVDDAAESLLTAARQGSFGAQTLSLFGPPQKTIELTAFPLADGALVAMEDISEKVRLDQVRTDFVANISHELKTPVGAISVLAETLEGEVTDELATKLAGRIVTEAQRMTDTINDLMELSRIEKAGERIAAPVDLVEVVRDSVQRVHALAERAGISIRVVTPESSPLVDGDYRQLVSAVGNVVDNAVKYSDEGSTVAVTVSQGTDAAVVQIEDSGIGVSAEHLDRIFERFYRADKARSRDTGGTGLGLSIVRNIVMQHGGQVNVESIEGKGSTFRLTFPLSNGGSSGTMRGNDHVVNK